MLSVAVENHKKTKKNVHKSVVNIVVLDPSQSEGTVKSPGTIWGFLCKKQVSRVWTSTCSPSWGYYLSLSFLPDSDTWVIIYAHLKGWWPTSINLHIGLELHMCQHMHKWYCKSFINVQHTHWDNILSLTKTMPLHFKPIITISGHRTVSFPVVIFTTQFLTSCVHITCLIVQKP